MATAWGGDPTEMPQWLVEVPLAHRGLHHLAEGVPENSLAAFRAAASAGVGAELDARLSADGVAVVAHDMDLTAATGQHLKLSGVRVATLIRMELFGTTERLPTLEQALGVLVDVPVMVEVKNEGARSGPLEQAVADLLVRHPGPVTVASFNPRSVAWFANNAPGVLRGQTGTTDAALPRVVRGAVRRFGLADHGRPHYWSWNVDHLDDERIVAARQAGQPVYAWTVRTAADLARARAGADNIIFEVLNPADLA